MVDELQKIIESGIAKENMTQGRDLLYSERIILPMMITSTISAAKTIVTTFIWIFGSLARRHSFVLLKSNLKSRSRVPYVEGRRTKVNEPLFYKNPGLPTLDQAKV